MKLITEIKNKLRKYLTELKKRENESWERLLFKKEHYPTYISQKVKRRVNVLRRTNLLTKTQKDFILPKVKSLALKMARLNLVEDRIYYSSQILLGLAFLPFVFGLSIFSSISIVANPWNSWDSTTIRPLAGESIWVVQIAFWAYLILSNFAFRKYTDRVRSNITFAELLSSFVVLTTLIGFSARMEANLFIFILYTVLFGIAGRSLFIYIVNLVYNIISFLMNQFFYDKMPESIVVNNILMILERIEKDPELLFNIESKKILIDRLDYVAQAISKDLPNLLRTQNGEFDYSTKTISQEIANSIRDKKLWVLTPREDTYHYLASFLSNFLFHFVKGDWDLLERLNIHNFTFREKWKKKYLPILRPVVFIGIPIAGYWALKSFGLTNEPWAGTVISYIVLWIIINVIWLIDPAAKDKLDSLKDTAGLFSFFT